MTVPVTTTAQWLAAWGSIGGATATTLAVLLGAVGLRGEIRRANEQRALDRVQREQDRRELRNRDAAQARLILTSASPVPPPHPDSLTSTHSAGEVVVTLVNGSQQPVLDVRLHRVQLRVHSERAPYEKVNPRWEWDFDPECEPDTGPILGGDQRRWKVVFYEPAPDGGADKRIRRVVTERDEYVVTVDFTDAAGMVWRRADIGQPELLLSPESDAT